VALPDTGARGDFESVAFSDAVDDIVSVHYRFATICRIET